MTAEGGTPQLSIGQSWRAWWDYERQRPIGGSPVARISQISRRWEVLRELVVRGLKARYSGSFLGYAWSIVQPLLLIGIYWLIFGQVARLNIQHYPLFIAAGMMPWLYFNKTLTQSMSSLTSNSGIIRTINLPREIFPLSDIGIQAIEYLLSLPVVFVFGFAFGVLPSRYLVLLPLSVLLETMLVTGAALFLAVTNTLFRDVQQLMRVVLRVWFYLSPIVYPANKFHGLASTIYTLNPLVGIVELNRLVWYPSYLTTNSTVLQHVIFSAVGAVVFLVGGWWTFISLERTALKEL